MSDGTGHPEDYRRLFEESPQPLLVCDAAARVVMEANEAALKMFGATREDLVGHGVIDFVDADDRAAFEEKIGMSTLENQDWGPWRFNTPDRSFDAVCQRRSVEFAGRQALIVHIQDVTLRVSHEKALGQSEQRYAAAVKGANDGIWDWDLVSDTVYYSARFCELLGYEEGDLGDSPKNWFSKVHPDDIEHLRLEIDLHLRQVTPRLKVEYRMQHRSGGYVWMLTRGVANFEEGHAVRMAGSQTDISDRKAGEERALQGTFYDRLTGLANRLLFLDRLGFLIRRAEKNGDYGFAILFIDLDRFKLLNESYGHALGDALLADVGKRLSKVIGTGDTLARLGGDEFGVILDGVTDPGACLYQAQLLLDAFSEPFIIGGDAAHLTASIGIALNDGRYGRSDDLLRDADTAMYRAKKKGRARYEVFDEQMHHEAVAFMRVEADLKRALYASEFELFYQPIIDLSDGSIAGSEALVRWNHPERGLVMPGEFIPIAEESGLIVPLGEWIMFEACRQCRHWLDQGLEPGMVSVNLSAHQLKSGKVQELVEGALSQAGLDGRRVQIELTESAVMEDPEGAIQVFRDIEKLGVSFGVDDFGTGYSSLAYLKSFRFGALKIDRSFIQDITTDAENAALVAAVIGLSHSFRAKCVGEGVETAEQLSYLRLLRCDQAQGYLFSRPVPAAVFEETLRSGVQGWHQLLF